MPPVMSLNGIGVLGFQAILGIATAVESVLVSIALASVLGVAGPVLGSFIAHVTIVLIPTLDVHCSPLARAWATAHQLQRGAA
jgi:hypothetical protein